MSAISRKNPGAMTESDLKRCIWEGLRRAKAALELIKSHPSNSKEYLADALLALKFSDDCVFELAHRSSSQVTSQEP